MRWALGVLAPLGVAVVMTMGPAHAHEGTGSTAIPTGPAPLGMSAMTPAEPAAASAGTGTSPRFQNAYFLAVLAVIAAGALVLRVARPVFTPGARPRAADSAAAAALLFAGAAHCAVTPSHWAEGWHLGLFFALSGLLLLGQGLAVWLRPTVATYGSVVASTAVFIVLYFLVREFSLPLVGHRDPYLFEEYPVKVAEALAAVVAVVALLRARPVPLRHRLAAS